MPKMGCRRAERAALALRRSGLTTMASVHSGASRRSLSLSLSLAGSLQRVQCFHHQRRPATDTAEADGKRIAIIGGGLTGLTTAYYLAKSVSSKTRITIYEASDRLGGWLRTDRVPVDVGGTKGVVSFERGPRTISSLSASRSRFDDLILYDLVSSVPC
jgi:protoporphyrinogen/coproporphyrinogen III oxidase